MAFRKRKYLGATSGRSVFKRRRTQYGRRRRGARGSRTKSSTFQNSYGFGLNYKSRMLKRSTWRRKLWNDTLAKTHYRSSGNGVSTQTTGTIQGVGNVAVYYPTFIGTPGPTTAFWTSTGGLQPPDLGATNPTFSVGDITIRGGRVGIVITVPDAVTDEIGVCVWVVKGKEDPNQGNIPAAIAYGSMIDAGPEFNTRVGKVLYTKTAILNNTSPSFSIEHRLRVEKIDQEIYATELGRNVMFIVACSNLTDTSDNTINVLGYHDLSFSADAAT